MFQRLALGGGQPVTATFAIGFLAGWLQVSGLKYTLERLSAGRAPRGLIVGSRWLRTALTLALFYWFCLPNLPIALAGWWLARTLAVKRWS